VCGTFVVVSATTATRARSPTPTPPTCEARGGPGKTTCRSASAIQTAAWAKTRLAELHAGPSSGEPQRSSPASPKWAIGRATPSATHSVFVKGYDNPARDHPTRNCSPSIKVRHPRDQPGDDEALGGREEERRHCGLIPAHEPGRAILCITWAISGAAGCCRDGRGA